jgi:hypothetical protein
MDSGGEHLIIDDEVGGVMDHDRLIHVGLNSGTSRQPDTFTPALTDLEWTTAPDDAATSHVTSELSRASRAIAPVRIGVGLSARPSRSS